MFTLSVLYAFPDYYALGTLHGDSHLKTVRDQLKLVASGRGSEIYADVLNYLRIKARVSVLYGDLMHAGI